MRFPTCEPERQRARTPDPRGGGRGGGSRSRPPAHPAREIDILRAERVARLATRSKRHLDLHARRRSSGDLRGHRRSARSTSRSWPRSSSTLRDELRAQSSSSSTRRTPRFTGASCTGGSTSCAPSGRTPPGDSCRPERSRPDPRRLSHEPRLLPRVRLPEPRGRELLLECGALLVATSRGRDDPEFTPEEVDDEDGRARRAASGPALVVRAGGGARARASSSTGSARRSAARPTRRLPRRRHGLAHATPVLREGDDGY